MEPNEEQQKVIDEFDSNVILFASAGTGKTYTVANKVGKILRGNLAKPEEILCLTFTIKACEEMRDDVLKYNEGADKVKINTIHSFCYDIIREEAKLSGAEYIDPEIFDDVDEDELLSRVIPQTLTSLHLDKYLKDCGLRGIESLYNKDVVCLDSGYDGKKFYWRMSSGGEPVLLNSELNSFYEKDMPRLFTPTVNFKCPDCGEAQTTKTNVCAHCGYDFRTYIPSYKFHLTKFRNLISEIKRYREIYNFYSGDEEADYQKTYLKLLERGRVDSLVKCRQVGFAPDGFFLGRFYQYAGKIVAGYNAILKEGNKVDFDDLIVGASNLLKDCAVKNRWRSKYKYIIVDEMQDTSVLEYSLLKKVFEGNFVMMCGDFFQTIYEWRGSDHAVLEDFIRTFGAKKFMFSENYRSTKTLTSATFGYLKNTYPDLLGEYCPADIKIFSKDEGEKIEHWEARDFKGEAELIYRYLLGHPELKPSNVCIMSRSNKYISNLYKYLTEYGNILPANKRLRFFTVEEDYRFYKKPLVKDFFAFYTLLLNKHSYVDMERLALRFLKGVGAGTLKKIRDENSCGMTVSAFLEEDSYTCGDWLAKLMGAYQNDNIVVYDIETTGLDLNSDQIVQIAAIKLDKNGEINEKFERFVIPDREISEGAYVTHGYDLDYIKEHGGVSAKQALTEFKEFAEGSVLVGHNSVKFDAVIVDRQLKECGLDPLNVVAEYDTLVLAKLFCPESPNYKLSTLCDRFGIVNERAHDAFEDICATAGVLKCLIEQKIAPTAEQRVAITKRYAERFKPFYEKYCDLTKLFEENDLTELNGYILEKFDIFKVYKEPEDRLAVGELFDNIEAERGKLPEISSCLQSFLTRAALAGSQMDFLISRLNKIPIITVHQSKGCEFDTVIIAGADSSNFPSFAAVMENNGEEEKRVFYVAISRAKRKLIFTNVANKRGYSPFIDKIPQEHIQKRH